jgi:hypothetical protein
MLVVTRQTARRHMPDNRNLNIRRHENLKSQAVYAFITAMIPRFSTY